MSQLASFSSSTYNPDKLIAGPAPLMSKKATLLSGENRTRGAVLGKKVTAASSVTGTADSGNTGNGTIGTLSAGTGAQVGTYRAVAIEPGTNLGTFAVYDPSGVEIGRAIAGTAFTGQVVFTIADGSTDFVSGDAFSIVVAGATEKYLLAVAAAVDGSQIADAVLAEDCDASAGDAECVVFIRGDFNENALTFGAGHSATTVRETLRGKGINLVPAIAG